jgi:aryl-alcohol dehydrogenase-like predicted oxidoreductase
VRRIGATDLEVFPLCLGGNVFGWTADRNESFRILDAYAAAGGNVVDTADVYSDWASGNTGGESEEILGQWMESRHARDRMVIATKVGQAGGLEGLAAATIRRAAEASLRRLGTDRIDLFYAHIDDPSTPLEETLGAFDALVREGKVRHVAASNITAPRLAEALAISDREGWSPYVAVQPHYNLVHRAEFEGDLAALCADRDLSCLPYSSLADGFLTGKYRPGVKPPASERAEDALEYLDDHGVAVLQALDEIAAGHGVPVAAVALAWLLAQPTVAAPIASARSTNQLSELLPAVDLQLTESQTAQLSRASAGRPD